MSKAVDTLMKFTDMDVASYLEACVHCGECAEACHFYLTTKDPRYTPTHKLKPLVDAYKRHKAPLRGVKGLLGLLPPEVTDDDLAEWEDLVYDSCNMCGRCTLVCPMGIDIAGTIRKMREAYAAIDMVPEGLQSARKNVEETSSPMRVTSEVLLKQIAQQEKETGLKIPVDVEGADYMATFSSDETMASPETIGAYAKIFHHAGISWTISTEAYEATNVGVQIGYGPLAAKLVQRIVDAAEKLKVKYLISPECGHAYGAIRWQGPNLIGRTFDFEVVHILELLEKLRAEGKLPVPEKDGRKMTLHDPCQIIRRGGLLKEPRRLMENSASNFKEMPGAGITNFCCGGGGGVSANPRAADLKIGAFGKKLEQIDAVGGVEAVVVPCANCRATFEDGMFEHDREDFEVFGVVQLVADTLDASAKGGSS